MCGKSPKQERVSAPVESCLIDLASIMGGVPWGLSSIFNDVYLRHRRSG